ncbi:MAG: GyrI-like domain-containing protein [Candidatus Magnetobacterium sp. LHC-1]|uniref:GyrI-like domain-containing protein n=1 Tax=Candidatus Magnetobacterium casense TaxID=1455061 RepID=A0ABS6RYX4_9BACT|nr:GyrI-like domain-containing protein [Candidatus Magnetobacterium casensis]MBF0608154.1 GyrI-like domain-containing protein [Nitrospirota bacterium]MBV6341850.1 GyrI-like domain-containing protein [Candidatus Magnetobacterium casensis]
MEKIDLKKTLKHLYHPSAKAAETVDVPQMNFLMIDGAGDPNTTEAFKNSAESLFSLSYTLKFMSKKLPAAKDYTVMPLEGLWWTQGEQFDAQNKDAWLWTLMIMQPEYVTKALFEDALEQAKKKKTLSRLNNVRFETFQEGFCAQIMHKGPFSSVNQTIEVLHGFIREQGYIISGKHHEIYLNDPHKTLPENMKTVLRQSVKPA